MPSMSRYPYGWISSMPPTSREDLRCSLLSLAAHRQPARSLLRLELMGSGSHVSRNVPSSTATTCSESRGKLLRTHTTQRLIHCSDAINDAARSSQALRKKVADMHELRATCSDELKKIVHANRDAFCRSLLAFTIPPLLASVPLATLFCPSNPPAVLHRKP
eukprot:1189911-Prorocentrum_minimum.AAC.2